MKTYKHKDYDTDMNPYYDFQRKKDYHKKFIWKLISEEHQELRERLYQMVIEDMIDDYHVPNDYFVGDELPQTQPPQTLWAWNCLIYRVSSVQRPFILMRKKANENIRTLA